MTEVDKALEDIRKTVELTGRSGAETVYLTDVMFDIDTENFAPPSECDFDGATVDFRWFLDCAKVGYTTPHDSPDKSFWLQAFGKDALPYGRCWRLSELYTALESVTSRKAVLFNGNSPEDPPCVLSYHFQRLDGDRLDVTVIMRSSDAAKVLPQDLMMTWFLLRHVANETGLTPGKIKFYISNCHVYYEDMEFPEEHIIDYGE